MQQPLNVTCHCEHNVLSWKTKLLFIQWETSFQPEVIMVIVYALDIKKAIRM